MAQKFEQVTVPVMVTIQKPVGSTWTDQEIANTVVIKSKSPKDVKVKGWHVETPA
jgi:hypothetical protein